MSTENEKLANEYNELLQNALSNPGVAEVMSFYAVHQNTLKMHNNLMNNISIPASFALSSGTNAKRIN